MLRSALATLFLLPWLAAADSGERLPAYLLQLPAGVATVLIAETDSSTLHRVVHDGNGIEYRDKRYMSIGQNGVGKQRPWDRRTPLGIYFVEEQLDTSRLHERYGPMAFPLDYPNAWDRRNGRSGDGIWIHGVAEGGGRRPALDTDGCIALPNDELLRLEKEIVPVVTPVIITRRMRWASPQTIVATRDGLSQALADWAASIRSGDLYDYLSAYADDFEYRGMNRDEWAHYRVETFGEAKIDDVRLEDILLLADPEDDRLYLSRFHQSIVENGRAVKTRKRLYWRRDDAGRYRIVAEDNG